MSSNKILSGRAVKYRSLGQQGLQRCCSVLLDQSLSFISAKVTVERLGEGKHHHVVL